MATQDFIVDTSIRNWVLGPLTAIMLLSGLTRHYVTLLLNSPPKPLEPKALREQRGLARGQLLSSNAKYIPPQSFEALKTHLSQAYDSGEYLKEPAPAEGEVVAPPNPLTDPNMSAGMMDMMKKQAVGFLPQTALMYYISFFYSGFVLTRLPFPLTHTFKSMLQRGIETPDMDVSWVSSMSWYFLCLFGLNSVYQLILGTANGEPYSCTIVDDDLQSQTAAEDTMTQAPGQQMPANPMAPAQDFPKLFKAQKSTLDIVDYKWVCDGVEERLLKL